MAYHQPVLKREVVKFLLDGDRRLFIDCTLGAGGHTEALLEAADRPVKILGIDKDPDALVLARKRLSGLPGVIIEQGDYAALDETAAKAGINEVDGILADLGQSSDQLRDPARGFSHRLDGPLDMRYDPQTGHGAADIINSCSQDELAEIFRRYGQERAARRIASAVVRSRPVSSTGQLASIIRKAVPGAYIEKTLSRIFMALRIVVNNELEAIERLLPIAHQLLSPGGRMVFISYDSNQDRLVKDFFRLKSARCTCPPEIPVCVCNAKPELRVLTPHVVKPARDEIQSNPRSRSARLRAAEKLKIYHEETI